MEPKPASQHITTIAVQSTKQKKKGERYLEVIHIEGGYRVQMQSLQFGQKVMWIPDGTSTEDVIRRCMEYAAQELTC
jgi:hypothetical protein